jgi:hypothetical protein
MLCNSVGKYTKQIFEYGVDVSISNFNYGFKGLAFVLVISYFFVLLCPGTCTIKGPAFG